LTDSMVESLGSGYPTAARNARNASGGRWERR
jgi:hypothetical protein